MEQDCWQVWPDRGFLMNPDPIVRLSDVPDVPIARQAVADLEGLIEELPRLLEARQARRKLEALPVYDFSALADSEVSFSVIEWLQQVYTFFAGAYVHAPGEPPTQRLPAPVAVPLHRLSSMVERPPIQAYCNQSLDNWRRIDPNGPIALDNLAMNHAFVGIKDEAWFFLVHVDIEARAAEGLIGLCNAVEAAERGDRPTVVAGLNAVNRSLKAMMVSFGRMPQGCDPDVFHAVIRPFIFGFDDMVYEGVAEYGGQPQSFRGGSGAQSSVIPAMVAGLGLQHEGNDLMRHLNVMKDYMPRPHREFVRSAQRSHIRDYVLREGATSAVGEAYNDCIETMRRFRKLHYFFAKVYIFDRVEDPVGTGGTPFMDWLKQLIDETAHHTVQN